MQDRLSLFSSATLSFVAGTWPGESPDVVTIRLRSGRRFNLPFAAAPEPDSPGLLPARPTHSPDFASVNWHGAVYTFSPKQRSVVAALWRAMDDGHHWVGQDALLELAESDCGRVRDLFRGHPAWGAMVVSAADGDGPPGAYRLAGPPAP